MTTGERRKNFKDFIGDSERMPHFIVDLSEEAPLFMSKTLLKVGWSFILWPFLYLEGWSLVWP